MERHPARERFVSCWREIRAVQSAEQVLEWDQETYMPAAGAEARARTLATLAGIKHARLTAPELSEAVATLASESQAEWQAQAREARRHIRRAAGIPRRLAEELAQAASAGLAAWEEARRQRSFAGFAAPLERLVGLKKEQAAALADGGNPYDALLDEFEPGATEVGLLPLFDRLRARLVPLVQAVAERPPVDESSARGDFPLADQRALGAWVAERIGFDFTAGRLDRSSHPFCLGVDRRDVRLTWRGQENDFRPALMGILHEAGHGLYEQGLPEAWSGTPLGEPASTAIHESQSRLWENMVGRGRPFWRWLLPHLRERFPQHDAALEDLWPALHAIRPSLIRVEADEATYHLHILVRFELERALFAGQLAVGDLPHAWDELYERNLGLRPRDAAEGVLQDLHWAMGAFGYFPTYTLGTMASVQLFAAARRALGGLDEPLASGEFAPLLDWLRREVHTRGALLEPAELLREATGEALSPAPLLEYLEAVAGEVYGVRLQGGNE
ncbi:MAG TPA: carboxypeptidase M32 [Thermoanaerobaculia bacterium]|nr:carboxypeptidase M32 [Thermoanaerobaculia bacterium]